MIDWLLVGEIVGGLLIYFGGAKILAYSEVVKAVCRGVERYSKVDGGRELKRMIEEEATTVGRAKVLKGVVESMGYSHGSNR